MMRGPTWAHSGGRCRGLRELRERLHGIGYMHGGAPATHVDGHAQRFFEFAPGHAKLDQCLDVEADAGIEV